MQIYHDVFHLQGALYCEQLTDVVTEMPNCYRNNTLQDNSSRRTNTFYITQTSNAENIYNPCSLLLLLPLLRIGGTAYGATDHVETAILF